MSLGLNWSREQHEQLSAILQEKGVRDGVTGVPGPTLDGIPLERTYDLIDKMRKILIEQD